MYYEVLTGCGYLHSFQLMFPCYGVTDEMQFEVCVILRNCTRLTIIATVPPCTASILLQAVNRRDEQND